MCNNANMLHRKIFSLTTLKRSDAEFFRCLADIDISGCAAICSHFYFKALRQ